jgi:DNA polymerase III alpha subunit
MADITRTVDAYGRVWFNGDDAIELLLRGYDIAALLIYPTDEIERYNAWCVRLDKTHHRVLHHDDDDLAADAVRRVNTWHLSEPFATLPVRDVMLQRCTTDLERTRVVVEMDLFEARGLLPVLRLMCMLVEHFRRNNILWGVGRGSSVASYVLFLIGVHKINALTYGLDISEFLRN